jgi:hypothetical protein
MIDDADAPGFFCMSARFSPRGGLKSRPYNLYLTPFALGSEGQCAFRGGPGARAGIDTLNIIHAAGVKSIAAFMESRAEG